MFRSIVTGTTFALLACGLLSTACISAQHPREASDRAAQVAYLYGYVAQVDGSAPRSSGSGIELAPGCHIVQTPEEWGGVGNDSAVVARTGRAFFKLDVLAGYRYEVVVGTSVPNEIHMRGSLQAIERDPSGKLTRSFAPLRSAHCGS